MAGYFLIANRRRMLVKEDFESSTNVLHFLSNCVYPEGIAMLLVKLNFLGGLRHFNAKFVGPFKISWILLLHEQDNPVFLFKDMMDPPVESWLVVKTYDFSTFGSLNGMRFLQINQVFPGQRSGFPRTKSLLSIGSIVANQWSSASGRSYHWHALLSGQQGKLPRQDVGGQRFHPSGHTGSHQAHAGNKEIPQ